MASSSPKKKKRNRRSRTPYPGIVPSVNPKSRWELIDHDYIDKLSHEEKQWLSNFNEETISGNFNHDGEILITDKEEQLECYGRNNARLRDQHTRNRTNGWAAEYNVDQIDEKQSRGNHHEDVLIELLDAKKKVDKT